MRILVTGATGYVGSRLVAALLENGHEVVAATRDPEKLGYLDATGAVRAGLPVHDVVPRGLMGWVAGAALPVPTGLAADLIESLDHSMTASDTVLRDYVPDPPGGLTDIDDAVAAAVSSPRPRPVDELADPHHLADSDPVWAGGDTLRLQQWAAAVTPSVVRPALRLLGAVPRPLAGVLRTGLDLLLSKVPAL